MLVTSLLGLLKGRQTSFVDFFSQLVIRESSDMGATSDDDELDDWGSLNMGFVDLMSNSKSKIDKQLLSVFKIR